MDIFSYYCFQWRCHTNLIFKPITGDSKVFLRIEFHIGHLLQKGSRQMVFFGIICSLTFHDSYCRPKSTQNYTWKVAVRMLFPE